MNAVLLVEDDPMSANLIRSLLQRPGTSEFDIQVADRLETARQRLQADPFDIILLDLSLPDSQGLETVHAVRAMAPRTPIIVLTNINDDKVALQAIEARAQDYLVKAQVNGLLLNRVLRHTIGRQQLISELEAQTEATQLEVSERQRAEEKLLISLSNLGAAEEALSTQYDALRTAKQAAEQERLHFETLARISPVGIFHTDATGRCLYVNHRWTEIAALSPALALNEGWLHAIHPEDRERVTAEWERSVRTQLPFHMEYRFGGVAGRPVTWVLGQSTAELDQTRKLIGFVGTITDITLIKQAEEQIHRLNADLEERVAARTAELVARTQELRIANEALQHTAALKDDFFSSMSHEIRTPLSGILQTAEAFTLGTYGVIEPRQLHAIQAMHESGQHLLTLINDILDLSKIEAGKIDLQVSPVPVEDICYASLAMISQIAHHKHLHLSTSLDSAVTLVQADGRRLKQMLVNLLSNAVKFTPEGGHVGLEVAGDAEHSLVRFTVWDTGVGIAPEQIGLLFQPFVQLNNRLSSQTYGTGLGLSLVLRMAELHGGGVTVESKPEAGSRFTISLPWQDTEAQVPPQEPHAIPPLVRRPPPTQNRPPASLPLILVVDDNAHVVQTLSDFLSTRSYQVMTAYNGPEGPPPADSDGYPDARPKRSGDDPAPAGRPRPATGNRTHYCRDGAHHDWRPRDLPGGRRQRLFGQTHAVI